MTSVALIGASGFVGQACAIELVREGFRVVPIRAPRLDAPSLDLTVDPLLRDWAEQLKVLTEQLSGCSAVVNAAGIANSRAELSRELIGANVVLPALISTAAATVGIERLVHVSSAAVQGDATVLDESRRTKPFSPYSATKAAGETVLLRSSRRPSRTIVLRPTSVHGPTRAVSASVARFASSALSSVAGDGGQPTPQVLVGNVASAVAWLTGPRGDQAPDIVLQPWEGLTTVGFLTIMGDGRRPFRLPPPIARCATRLAKWGGRRSAEIAALARRLEMAWFGQEQVEGWLSASGFIPPHGVEAWHELARQLRTDSEGGA